MMSVNIPEKGKSYKEVLAMLDAFGKDDPSYKEAKTWSLVYYLSKEHTEFLEAAYAKYFSANGLNPTVFKSLKRLEKEVLKFTAEMLHADDDACGVMTSGGTESCLLAVKTYRDFGKARGIRKPEIILPETAHVAWKKGAEYFGVRIRRAPLAKDLGVDAGAVEKLVNKNTIMILGSAPEYPHGIIDPIGKLGEIASAHGVPLHVDACVGGYILPFIEANGAELPLWDFRVLGVTSVSADIHKYGFAAKGASCILYRSIDHFKHQIFVSQDWPGGVFASPALLGTRPGGAYAAAWAAIQANGREGYMKLAKRTMDAANKLKEGISKTEGLELIGEPKASLFSYRSTDPRINIYAVGDVLEQKGWCVDRLQRPDALHAMVTAAHDKVVDKYLADLEDAVKTAIAHPELGEKGQAATYGMISHIPLRGMVRKQVADMFAESYRLDAKEIDMSDSEALAPGAAAEGGAEDKKGILQGIINWYVKRKMRKG
jgi:sphinganine-1-phosphate aldolase